MSKVQRTKARKRVALYLRISKDDRTTKNQRRELEVVAKRNGWDVVARFEDAGISGAKGRDQRPGFDALMKGVTRREFDLVAAWSIDRLGRSLKHLIEVLGDLQATGTDLYLHQQALDTSTPTGRAMFQMAGVFAEWELGTIRERIHAGLARARDEGVILGRPRLEESDAIKVKAVLAMRAKGVGIRRIATELGVGVGTVIRLTA